MKIEHTREFTIGTRIKTPNGNFIIIVGISVKGINQGELNTYITYEFVNRKGRISRETLDAKTLIENIKLEK